MRLPPLLTIWWVLTGSNRRHSPCKGDALPAELSTRTNGGRKLFGVEVLASTPIDFRSAIRTQIVAHQGAHFQRAGLQREAPKAFLWIADQVRNDVRLKAERRPF